MKIMFSWNLQNVQNIYTLQLLFELRMSEWGSSKITLRQKSVILNRNGEKKM